MRSGYQMTLIGLLKTTADVVLRKLNLLANDCKYANAYFVFDCVGLYQLRIRLKFYAYFVQFSGILILFHSLRNLNKVIIKHQS